MAVRALTRTTGVHPSSSLSPPPSPWWIVPLRAAFSRASTARRAVAAASAPPALRPSPAQTCAIHGGNAHCVPSRAATLFAALARVATIAAAPSTTAIRSFSRSPRHDSPLAALRTDAGTRNRVRVGTAITRRCRSTLITPKLEQQLARIVEKYEALKKRMAEEGETLSATELIKLSKEVGNLEEIANTSNAYVQLSKSLDEIEKMLSDTGIDSGMRDLAQEEKTDILLRIAEAEKAVIKVMLPRDPKDDGNTIMEIRPGTGGNEANLFAMDLMKMYQRFAVRVGWSFETIVADVDAYGGLKEGIIRISGKEAFGLLKFENGTHRVQRIPSTEGLGRVHTSAACVLVMPERVDDVPEVRKSDLIIETMRSNKPGGQHVNTTDSAVRIVHVPTGITVMVTDERSQHQNRAKALEIVAARVAHLARAKSDALHAATRKSLSGTGERSDKIRTYNFQQDRVTDHRIGLTKHSIYRMMEGETLMEVVNALRMHAETKAMAEWQ